MKKLILAPLLVGVLVVGCKKDPEVPAAPVTVPPHATLRLLVQPVWNGAPFDKNLNYINAANESVQIQQVKFYLSSLRVKGDGGETTLSLAELLDVTDGPLERSYEVPVGSYDSLGFGLGLPPELNHADITEQQWHVLGMELDVPFPDLRRSLQPGFDTRSYLQRPHRARHVFSSTDGADLRARSRGGYH
jgi:hypothetical protein